MGMKTPENRVDRARRHFFAMLTALGGSLFTTRVARAQSRQLKPLREADFYTPHDDAG